jgi:PmbA protein
VALAMAVCAEITGKDERVISSESGYSDSENFSYRIASNGFEGESSNSSFSLYGVASIKSDGDERPSSYWNESSLFFDDLIKDGIGAKALERALSKLGQQKTASAKLPMIVDFLSAGQLLSPVLNAINGASIQQKNSFLLDKVQQKVFNDKMTLMDEPHLIRSAGARHFDGEGVATQKRTIFDAGVLNLYFIDTYNSNKLNMPNTISAPSILTIPAGTRNAIGLARTVEKGILVTGFNGGNCNPTTGDFSYGIEGFLIEKGAITQPVNEMNITGNMLALWSNLMEIGNDARLTSSRRIPSLLFDNVDFSGL